MRSQREGSLVALAGIAANGAVGGVADILIDHQGTVWYEEFEAREGRSRRRERMAPEAAMLAVVSMMSACISWAARRAQKKYLTRSVLFRAKKVDPWLFSS
jgi:altronate dehydratase